jgi:hypothetical protein
MTYICQNCGATSDGQKTLCNPILEGENTKLCSDYTSNVCLENASRIEYSCPCGNVSVNREYLCYPTRMCDTQARSKLPPEANAI